MTSVNLQQGVQLKRRITVWAVARWYALYGPAGVVAWGVSHWDSSCEVSFHSPRPLWNGAPPEDRCPFLEMACYLDSGHLDLGQQVFVAWAVARRDDEVVWRALAEMYGDRLGGRWSA